jgi:hypothetical protein
MGRDKMKVDFKVTEILTLPNTIMAAICLASGLMLFMPNWFVERMYMVDFKNSYGSIIGGVFLISFCILIVNIIYRTSKSINSSRLEKKFLANAEKRLRSLSTYQKAIVYLLYCQDNRTHELPVNDGAVVELEFNHFIGKAASQYAVSDINNAVFPFMLQPWVSNELVEKESLLSELRKANDELEMKYSNTHNKGDYF